MQNTKLLPRSEKNEKICANFEYPLEKLPLNINFFQIIGYLLWICAYLHQMFLFLCFFTKRGKYDYVPLRERNNGKVSGTPMYRA